MDKIYNFSAGPAVLPEEVLKEAAVEMLDYRGCGMSVMEMSHRTRDFEDILEGAKSALKEVLSIPETYEILFMQGGATAQFAALPMNLMVNKKAGFIETGVWAKKAMEEAAKYGEAIRLASSGDKNFSYIPDCDDLDIPEDLDYVHICENNTIYGTKYKKLPDTKGKILVSDVSSCFLSEPMDVSKYGVVFGGVQKNIGPAGLAIVIIRKDLIREDVMPFTPTIFNYKITADNDSMYNTPACYNIYICGKVFRWILESGGLSAMKERNERKAAKLYKFLDESRLFSGTVEKEYRSLMNVPFVTGSPEIDKKFIEEANLCGLKNLKGHRSVGGMRASIYNAMPLNGVEKLIDFMEEFEKKNPGRD